MSKLIGFLKRVILANDSQEKENQSSQEWAAAQDVQYQVFSPGHMYTCARSLYICAYIYLYMYIHVTIIIKWESINLETGAQEDFGAGGSHPFLYIFQVSF